MLSFSEDSNNVPKFALWESVFTFLIIMGGVIFTFVIGEYTEQQWSMLGRATLETLFMVSIASVVGFTCGGGVGLYIWNKGQAGLSPSPLLYKVLSLFINSGRSVPYIIFMVLLIPLTRICMGTSIGVVAATFPLTLGAILLFTRFAEDTFKNIPKGIVEMGQTLGASNLQILFKIVVFESMPQLTAHLTNMIVMLIGFSAMAGAIGGGGLGDLAIRYGYQRYDLPFLFLIVFILILMVQCVQGIGDFVARKMRK